MRDILKLGAILMIYALVAGSALAFVNDMTIDRIRENRLASENEARLEALPGMEGGFDLKDEGSEFPYWVGYSDAERSEIGGYVFITRGSGYSSIIESMVGVDRDGTVISVKILSQQETPGLGARVNEIRHGESDPWFTRQFIGKTANDDIKVIQDDGNIDAITGATISSRTVTDSIDRGLKELMISIGGGS